MTTNIKGLLSRPDIDQALRVPMTTPLDSELVNTLLSTPPFHKVSGLFNLRDLSDGSNSAALRKGYIYRSGSLERLPLGVESPLSTRLNITTIFDLRSHQERLSKPDPELPGLEVKWKPSTWDNETTAAAQQKFDEDPDKPFSFTSMYVDMLTSHHDSFRSVFEHIRDYPDKPLLFHCTAGIDRTGVMAALILGVAGADLEYINREYALTRFGIEPAREFLIRKLQGEGREIDMNSQRMQQYAKLPLDIWTHVFNEMNERYGGIEGYVKQQLGFSDDDIRRVRTNLREKQD